MSRCFTWIDCPEHLTHKVKLFTYGHKYAGVWECNETNEGISGSCPHTDTQIEEAEAAGRPEDTAQICVCILCGVEVND